MDFSFPNKNIMMLVVASACVVLLLPFTLSLLFIAETSKISNHYQWISFIDKLKPFFDAYTGKMKDNA